MRKNLLLRQEVHSCTQGKRDFVEGLDREVIPGFLALDLPDKIVGQTNRLCQLGGGHALFLAVLFDIPPDHVIYGLLQHDFFHSHHLSKLYPGDGRLYVRQYRTFCLNRELFYGIIPLGVASHIEI